MSNPRSVPGPDEACDLERGDDKPGRMRKLWQRYGDCYRVHSQTRAADTWVINHPDWVKRVLVSNHRNYVKGVGIERVRVLLGNGIMASEGERWRRQRRMLQSAFHRARIEGLFGIWLRQAVALAERWQAAARAGEAVDVSAAVSETTLRAVLEALFSEDLDALERAHGGNPFLLVSSEGRRDLQFAVRFRALGRLVLELAGRRRRERRFPPDLLSHCLQVRDKSTGEAMPERLLVDEILTLVVAGHETTAAALNWVWYLLASHPQVYERVSEEGRLLDPGQVPDWSRLESLQWIPRVIQEALRLYPPGWLYTRRALEADRFGDYRLPAGSDVFICSYLLHRHPDYWERPDEFLPQRFAPQQAAQRHPYAYIPFSAGPRHCIGETFAMSEMMVHVAVLAARLRFQAPAGGPVALEADVNLRPREHLWLRPALWQ